MKVNTFAGRTYSVTSPNGCTVTTEDGLTLAEVEAGKQGYFVAVSGKVLLSDDAAVLTQVFKLAPYQKLRLLGVVGGGVPAWLAALKTELTALLDGSKFELAWLSAENTLVVHTDRISDELGDAVTSLLERVLPKNIEVERYNHHIEVSWRDINKYAACVDAQAVYEANPEVNQWTGTSKEGGRGYQFFDVCSDGAIPFSFDSLKNIAPLSGGYAHNMFDYLVMQRGVKKLHLKLPIITEWVGINGLEEINLDAPNLISFIENYSRSLKRLKVNSLKIISLNYAAWNAPIESIEGEFPVLQSGKISENNGILDKASVLRICNTVPTWTTGTHELWLGIHVDHKTDEEVLEAIANAETKGWTLTVQWNGTPTAQASTFAMGSLIYARVGELENGERYLDWGHYVTDTTGYEEFRSVEAAREYYGLPEDDLTETE